MLSAEAFFKRYSRAGEKTACNHSSDPLRINGYFDHNHGVGKGMGKWFAHFKVGMRMQEMPLVIVRPAGKNRPGDSELARTTRSPCGYKRDFFAEHDALHCTSTIYDNKTGLPTTAAEGPWWGGPGGGGVGGLEFRTKDSAPQAGPQDPQEPQSETRTRTQTLT